MSEQQNSLPVQALPDGSAELRLVLRLRWEDIAALGREAGRMAAQLKRPVGLDEAAGQRLSTWSAATSSASSASSVFSASSPSAASAAPAASPVPPPPPAQVQHVQASARHRAESAPVGQPADQGAVVASASDAAGDRAARVSSLISRATDQTRATG